MGVWLKVREATVRKMLGSGRFSPDFVFEASTSLLVDSSGMVESPLYYQAVSYVVSEKFSGVNSDELLRAAARGSEIDSIMARLEIIRRAQ